MLEGRSGGTQQGRRPGQAASRVGGMLCFPSPTPWAGARRAHVPQGPGAFQSKGEDGLGERLVTCRGAARLGTATCGPGTQGWC